MGKWAILGAVLVSTSVFTARARGDVSFTDNFSSGLRPQFWTVSKTANYTVDDTQGDVRISTPKPGSRSYRAANVFFTPQVVGNFDMKINFHDAQLDLVDFAAQSANQLALHAQFGGQHFASTRDIATVEGNNYHVYLNPPGQTVGVTPTTLLAGELRVTRVGSIYAGYFNGNKIYEATFANPAPQQLWFSLENNVTNDVTSVVYDDFSINAENIIGIPEPAACSLLGGVACVGLLRRGRPRKSGAMR